MGFRQISILGVGLLGGSVGLSCRQSLSETKIVGYAPWQDELQKAIDQGAIQQGFTDPAEAVVGADLVILCTPVGVFDILLNEISPALKIGAIVSDVGSTKRSIVQAAKKILDEDNIFVGSHPMAGGEKHGIDHARADLLDGALCILTPTPSTDLSALHRVEAFWQMLKMRTIQMTPEDHDEATASVSHVPHVVAAALVRMQTPLSLQLAARGFLDSTRIAAGDSALWRDILCENRDNVRNGIVNLQQELQQLLLKLDAEDHTAVQQWLQGAANARVRLASQATS